MTYSTFKDKKSSEKITLVHAHSKAYLYEFDVYSGSVYDKTPDHFVAAIEKNGIAQTLVSSVGAVADGTYFYDITANKLYIHTSTYSTDEYIVTYRHFYSSAPINMAYDLTDTGAHVAYEARVKKSVPYSVTVDNSNTSVVIIGSGSLTLENTDKALDSIFSKLYWEGQSVKIYSYNRDIVASEAKLIYDGIIEYKKYDDFTISFKIKSIFEFFKRDVDNTAYASGDGVRTDLIDTIKSRVFGTANGVKLVSTDAIPDAGYTITGTISGNAASATVTGSGTSFLKELSPNDVVTTADGNEFTVLTVQSDTSLTTASDLETTFTAQAATSAPEQGLPFKNRVYEVAEKALRETQVTINIKLSGDKFVVSDIDDLQSGDIIEVNSQFREIETVTDGSNTLITTTAFDPQPVATDTFTRHPVQAVYYQGEEIAYSSITYNNNEITLDDNFEQTITGAKVLDTGSWSYSVSGRTMTRSAANEALGTIVKPRDYVSLDGISYYEVLNVGQTTIDVRTAFAESKSTSTLYVKSITVVGNDSIISADVFGETEDDTTSGTWVKTGSQVVKKLLTEAGLASSLNTTSFDTATANQNATVSMVLPKEAHSTSMPTLKDTFDYISESLLASLIIDTNQQIKYLINQLSVDFDTIPTLTDYDVISWKSKIESNELYSQTIVEYNNKQVDTITEESSVNTKTVNSALVTDVLGLVKTLRRNTCYLKQADADAAARRLSLMHELNNTVISVQGSLNLSDYGVGDPVRVDFDLPTNFGDIETNERIMVVTSIKNDGEFINMVLSDLGNLYARRCITTPDTANEYTAADTEEKLLYSYITDSRGLVDTSETTKGRNITI
jgi:hypothetical protein